MRVEEVIDKGEERGKAKRIREKKSREGRISDKSRAPCFCDSLRSKNDHGEVATIYEFCFSKPMKRLKGLVGCNIFVMIE